MKSSKLLSGLLPKIILAILLGIGCGYFLPLWGARIFATFNLIFSEFLGFCIPLIIIGFVAPAIADIGARAGRMLVATALLAYLATLCAGLLSYGVGQLTFPRMIMPDSYLAVEASGENSVTPFFTISIPPIMSVMTALVISFILGIGASRLKGDVIRKGLDEFRIIVDMVIRRAIVPLLPLYIFGIFLNMTVTGEVAVVLGAFMKIILVIFGLHIFLLIAQYSVAALFANDGISRNPLKLLGTMMPAYFTALGTQSSAATIPVTLERTVKMGVDKDVAGFTVPLCATIHMSGSCLKLVACAMALMLLKGIPYDFGMFMGFIAMLGITIVAAPGVPGGAVMASLGLLSSILGFTETDNALMIALYIAMDSFGTACNVTGDGAISIIINRFFAKRGAQDAALAAK
ncbi:MAG: dicarboxylate/amino acid:cation symporter [Muribaculaceae bacterium]|nr:dicarboxylate/amino acid:cation symporter [Muribaculaceae bacterium]